MKRAYYFTLAYNISAETLFSFLLVKGYDGELKLSTKISHHYEELIDKEFKGDKEVKEEAIKFELPKNKIDIAHAEIAAIGINQTRRIAINTKQEISYKEIFGPCFWGCSIVRCIDPYVREANQIQNVERLLDLIQHFSSKQVNFSLTTCYDKRKVNMAREIQLGFNEIILRHDKFNLNFSIEEDTFYHDRHIFVDNKYIIDLSRGLDIFENYHDSFSSINKNCTIFITRLT